MALTLAERDTNLYSETLFLYFCVCSIRTQQCIDPFSFPHVFAVIGPSTEPEKSGKRKKLEKEKKSHKLVHKDRKSNGSKDKSTKNKGSSAKGAKGWVIEDAHPACHAGKKQPTSGEPLAKGSNVLKSVVTTKTDESDECCKEEEEEKKWKEAAPMLVPMAAQSLNIGKRRLCLLCSSGCFKFMRPDHSASSHQLHFLTLSGYQQVVVTP